ncbi:FeoA family protein [Methanosarcina sp.]|uniref:FeoA family protein n=1 Tax=Methanosarcina sp. TaxID=2213 RepID=UPI0029898BAA|nr:FeoA family protein [Methanosarcina sp.]MDW5549579.1 FeoA family protein [Methanosarcina sp.]MDW5553611.1 FeoA family protein [Methanosarcina sp.]MDW5558583.1 FeoA family protein [Methanosarcina sp.]
MMPLVLAQIGEANRIKAFWGQEKIKNHLENLGFTAGSEVCVLSKTFGNVIVSIKDSRIAISEELAKKIMV